jgi:hypothetical protein
MSLLNPVTPPGIDPETIELVAQRLNHFATSGPISSERNSVYSFLYGEMFYLFILLFEAATLQDIPSKIFPTKLYIQSILSFIPAHCTLCGT